LRGQRKNKRGAKSGSQKKRFNFVGKGYGGDKRGRIPRSSRRPAQLNKAVVLGGGEEKTGTAHTQKRTILGRG